MRRSSAPSQNSSSKRCKFTPTFKRDNEPDPPQKTEEIHPAESGAGIRSGTGTSRSVSDIINLIKTPSTTTSDRVAKENVPSEENNSTMKPNIKLKSSHHSTDVKPAPLSTSVQHQIADPKFHSSSDEEQSQLSVKTNQMSESKGSSSCQPQTDSMTDAPIVLTQPLPVKPKFSAPKRKGFAFRTPVSKTSGSVPPSSVQDTTTGEVELTSRCYYNVMWCKLSKKKHKKWEGDAILTTSGRSATLQDMEGKMIGKGSGFKTAELSTLDEGHTLMIGGKEIEVMSKMSEAAYKSGKCFQQASAAPAVTTSVHASTGLTKPFQRPQLSAAGEQSKVYKSTPTPITPKFDPLHPDALVMPRPSQSHELQYNRRRDQVIDVVVDPHLAVHLRPHQRDGVTFLYQCIMGMKDYNGNGVILADDMGLGKTLQCISILWTLLKQGPYGMRAILKKVLVVTPSSLVKNWCSEFKKWLGSERLSVFSASSDNRVDEFIKSPIYPVMVISYEMFMRCYDDICKVNFDLIVCDEGHRLKNSTIKTTSMIANLPTRRRIILTGTPIQNDLQEFYSIVDFCNPGILGSSSAFRKIYEEPIVASKQPGASVEVRELGRDRAAELSRLTSLFILRRTQEINNKYLPPKSETVVFCRPSALQLSIYHKLLSSRLVRSCLNYGTDGTPHLVCIGALKKLCNHPNLLYQKAKDVDRNKKESIGEEEDSLYGDLLGMYPDNYDPEHVACEHSGKLAVVSQLLSSMHQGEVKEKIVLVSNYTQTLDLLQKLCEVENYSYLRLDGQTPAAKRQQIVDRFNSRHSHDFVFLLSSKAGGTGLNLIGASRLLLYDIDWNPANDLQAMARVWRDGQRKKVHIYRLLTTGTIEEKVYQRQISKQGLSGTVVDSKTSNNMNFSRDDLKDIFSLREHTSCDTHDLLDCSCLSSLDEPTIRHPKNKQKSVSMDELKEWIHVSTPTEETFKEDEYLTQASDSISFIFWHESYQQQ